MAKQSGIHQLRGKVGEHSYYRQTGVSTGLVRSINQGMSERVKTSEEYANTRLNNAEFGQAGAIAACLARLIVPKFRPMMLPFSQSKMAKIILDAIKQSTLPWGTRNIPTETGAPAKEASRILVSALNSVRKGNPSDIGISMVYDDDTSVMSLETDEVVWDNYLRSIGADGAKINMSSCAPWIGKSFGVGQGYAECYPQANTVTHDMEFGRNTEDFPDTFPEAPAPILNMFRVEFWCAVIMPYRVVNDTQYILQEHCTYLLADLNAAVE